MLVLFETPAGYALFKVLAEGKLKKTEDVEALFRDAGSANEVYVAQDGTGEGKSK
jgi:nucleolar protein 58